MQVQELVGIIPWTFVAQICNLFIQMYLIKRFLFKPVHEILEKRRAAADAEIIQAEETKAKAEAIRAEYERNMQDARQKANEILDSARNTAAIQSETMKNKAEKEIAQEKKKAVNEVKGEIGDMAVEIAGKVIEREINEKDHEKLIDEFISNVGEVS